MYKLILFIIIFMITIGCSKTATNSYPPIYLPINSLISLKTEGLVFMKRSMVLCIGKKIGMYAVVTHKKEWELQYENNITHLMLLDDHLLTVTQDKEKSFIRILNNLGQIEKEDSLNFSIEKIYRTPDDDKLLIQTITYSEDTVRPLLFLYDYKKQVIDWSNKTTLIVSEPYFKDESIFYISQDRVKSCHFLTGNPIDSFFYNQHQLLEKQNSSPLWKVCNLATGEVDLRSWNFNIKIANKVLVAQDRDSIIYELDFKSKKIEPFLSLNSRIKYLTSDSLENKIVAYTENKDLILIDIPTKNKKILQLKQVPVDFVHTKVFQIYLGKIWYTYHHDGKFYLTSETI
ncbi:MAG: Unknown protein [uncultured Sulfurovum sp.]|uniref:Lipoprotein n=1 Tax=uncultured Sulfurovum sp. TaxID=269237 RepID=A0A6S6SI54_9BACT|nr:MAG: Unknown protein [uncultured Sulfurovum sp.]